LKVKDITAVIGAIAALIAAIATFESKTEQYDFRKSGVGDNVQFVGNNNQIKIEERKKMVIDEFTGEIQDDIDNKTKKSNVLSAKFDKFIFDHNHKIVKLNIFPYYTDDDFQHKDNGNITLDSGGFPSPMEWHLNTDCQSSIDICYGTAFIIDGDINKIEYNPAFTSRSINGYFRVLVAGMNQGNWTVQLKPVDIEHIELIQN
jgi:hypothetical protein